MPDFDKDVAFPVRYLLQVVPLNDIVWDIVKVLLGVSVLISRHWCFKVEVVNVKTGILCTVSGNSAIDMDLGSRQVGCRCLSFPSVATLLPPTVIRIRCVCTFWGRISQMDRRYIGVILLEFFFTRQRNRFQCLLLGLCLGLANPTHLSVIPSGYSCRCRARVVSMRAWLQYQDQ